jgi:hypothetical protein
VLRRQAAARRAARAKRPRWSSAGSGRTRTAADSARQRPDASSTRRCTRGCTWGYTRGGTRIRAGTRSGTCAGTCAGTRDHACDHAIVVASIAAAIAGDAAGARNQVTGISANRASYIAWINTSAMTRSRSASAWA